MVREIQRLSMARRARLESGPASVAWPATTGGAGFITRAKGAPCASGGCPAIIVVAVDDRARRRRRRARRKARRFLGPSRARRARSAASTRCLRASASGGNPGRSDVVPLPRAHRFRRGENARSRERPTATCGWEMNPRLESGRFRRSILESRISTNHARGIISLGVTGNQRVHESDSSFLPDTCPARHETQVFVRAGDGTSLCPVTRLHLATQLSKWPP